MRMQIVENTLWIDLIARYRMGGNGACGRSKDKDVALIGVVQTVDAEAVDRQKHFPPGAIKHSDRARAVDPLQEIGTVRAVRSRERRCRPFCRSHSKLDQRLFVDVAAIGDPDLIVGMNVHLASCSGHCDGAAGI